MPFIAICEKCGTTESGDCSTENNYLAIGEHTHEGCGGKFIVEAADIKTGTFYTPTPWHPSEQVVVFKKPDGTYSFPMRNDKPCPKGWQKITATTDRELAQIERSTHSLSERRWFDSGTGRGFDDSYRGRKL